MAQEKEPFLSRWSRLKQDQAKTEAEAAPPAESKPDEAAPVLPPVDELTPEADFSPFMHPKVGDALRRAALRKLFADPRFNVPDPYEAYSGDWTGGEPISKELLATLNQARSVLFPEQKQDGKDLEEKPQAAPEQPPEEADGAGRKDA
jgi:hypothetical protein